MHRASRWLVLALMFAAGQARADIDSQLSSYEAEARQIGTDIPKPGLQNGFGQRKLIDAQLSFSLGDYETAALALFELATQPGPEQDTATYYLGEALFQKGDRGAARAYLSQTSQKAGSKYVQPSLQRLVEIAIAQNDFTDVDSYVAQLDRSPEGIYVRGKLAFAQGKFDEAQTLFGDVPKGDLELQAQYYLGTTAVAKKDLTRALEIFTDLIGRTPKTSNDRRVVELSQLALGRLYYERDQPSKAIDSYLLIDRRSDLFADALYEVAWVYVKGKQYDKALRALELLQLSEPDSTRTSTTRLLEGNLRIRKAQMIRASQIAGTLLDDKHDDPAVEYDKAVAMFTETHDLYLPSYQALEKIADTTANADQYLVQIAGRSSHVFQTQEPLPDAAAEYLRDVPDVQRAVAVETDLGEIEQNLTQAESMITRLEGVLASPDKSTVYPSLAARRSRIGQIQDDLIAIRNSLADQQLKQVSGGADLQALTARRLALASQYQALPKAEVLYAQRVEEANAQLDVVDESLGEVSSALDGSQALAVALRKYATDVPAEQKTTIVSTLESVAAESDAIDKELVALRNELALGRDLAGSGDEGVLKARQVRRELKAALDGEHRTLATLASSGSARKLAALGDRAARLSEYLDQIEHTIDGIVETSLDQVKGTIAKSREDIIGYKTELAEHETESRSLGATVLGASFKDVKARFYDVIIRTDVGSVDVSWSQKEDTDDDLKRLNLSRQRELKQLKDEFKDILSGVAPTTPGTSKPVTPPPPPSPTAPSGSPDKGAGEGRVKPGSEVPQGTPVPNVKPDAKGSR
jgi:tetratricopeptide (TPR) repeat protein